MLRTLSVTVAAIFFASTVCAAAVCTKDDESADEGCAWIAMGQFPKSGPKQNKAGRDCRRDELKKKGLIEHVDYEFVEDPGLYDIKCIKK